MPTKNDEFGYWFGWAVAFGIAAVFFILAVWQGTSLKEVACKPDETDCFRQWVTALGSWAAVVAAVPSVIYLGRQIRSADRQFKTNTTLSLYRNRALATHVKGYASLAIKIMDEHLNELPRERPLKVNDLRELMRSINDLLSDARLDVFEQDVESPPVSVKLIRRNVELYRQKLDRAATNTNNVEDVFNLFPKVFAMTADYLEVVIKASTEYLATTSAFAAGLGDAAHAWKASST